MSNYILFSHTDLDGIGAGVLFERIFGHGAETHYCGYETINERVASRLQELRMTGELPSIFITDISVNQEVAELLSVYEGSVHLFDHHESAKWLAQMYSWAQVDTTICGTKIFAKWIREAYAGIDISELDEFIDVVNDYDLWIHEWPRSKEMNRLFYILGIERFLKRFRTNPSVLFEPHETLLLELEDETIAKYVDKVSRGMKVYEWNGDIGCGIAFADRFQSEVAHELMEMHELEMVVIVDVNSDKISLRSKGKVNVSRIAMKFGGGGHPCASGFTSKHPFTLPATLNIRIQNAFEAVINEDIEKEMFGGVE